MTKFNYVARDSKGESISGSVTAATVAAANKQLRGEGKFPVKLEPAGRAAHSRPDGQAAPAAEGKPAEQGISFGGGRVKKSEVIYVTTQLAVMAETGVPLADALDSVASQLTNPKLKSVLLDVAERVKSGEEFSASLARHPKIFGSMYVAMVKAAEASGTLGVMLDRICSYLSEEEETRKKVTAAMIYPVSMCVFAISVTVFLMTWVLPKFTSIYEGQEAALPAITSVVMSISNVLVGYWPFLVGGLAASITGFVLYIRTEGGADWWAGARLRIPLLGKMWHKLFITRTLRTMGTLIGTGVSMLEAVEITRSVAGRGPFARLWGHVDEALRSGQQLSEPLFRERLMPRGICQMITAGERTGTLPEVLERVSVFCDRELKRQIKVITSMIEPVMIVAMGLIVGCIVIALLLPIFSISRVMTGGH